MVPCLGYFTLVVERVWGNHVADYHSGYATDSRLPRIVTVLSKYRGVFGIMPSTVFDIFSHLNTLFSTTLRF